MKLSSKITGNYSNINPDIARDRLLFITSIKNIISKIINSDNLSIETDLKILEDKLVNRDNTEYCSLCNALISSINDYYNGDIKMLQRILYISKVLVDSYINSENEYDCDIIEKFVSIMNVLREKFICNNVIVSDIHCDALVRHIGSIISSMKHKLQNDVPYTHRYITPLDIQNDINVIRSTMSESIDGGYIVKSIANYSTTKYFPQLTRFEFSPEYYTNIIYHETDDDYVISRIKQLPDFLSSILNREDCYDSFIHICEFLYDKFSNNATALELFLEALNKCINILETSGSSQYTQRESYDRLIDYCEKLIGFINADINQLGRKPAIDHSPLIEMGFGYIYDILPSNCDDITPDNIDAIGKAMVEAAEEYDVMNILTEAFGFKKSNKDMIRREIKNDVENDVYRQRLQNKYVDERREEEDRYSDRRRDENDKYYDKRREEQDKYSDRRRVKDDRYSDRRRAKDDKYSDKRREEQYQYEKKKEEKERRKNATKTAWAKWKTMELTNATAYSAIRALKRLVTATAVGGVSYAAGFNPVFLPIVYLLGKYMGDNTNPEKTKMKIMQDIKHTLSIIESKIDQAERQNDMKQKYQLIRMRDKLESQFKQMGYSSPSGIGGKV